jgi:hypothetical protein
MGARALSRCVAEQRLVRRQGQHFAQLHLGFVPLENQHAMAVQHTEALGKALAQIGPPVVAEFSVLRGQPRTRPC